MNSEFEQVIEVNSRKNMQVHKLIEEQHTNKEK
jgi:hypothetical protein